MMRIAKMAAITASALLVSAGVSNGQQAPKLPRIGFLSHTTLSKIAVRFEAFRQGLRDLGYEEGRNVTIAFRSSEGHNERLPAIAAGLVRENVDVIVTTGSPAPQAARAATGTIPIVVVVGVDRHVASLRRPGGNITGLSSIAAHLVPKQLEILKETISDLTRVALLWNTTHRGHPRNVKQAKQAAPSLRLDLVSVGVSKVSDFPDAFRRMAAEGVGAVVISRGGLFVRNRTSLAALAGAAGLPTMFGHPVEAREDGALLAYGTMLNALFRRAATYVDKILKGADPGELPVERPTHFALVVNLKTAKALGITVPASILLRATEVIE